MMRISTQMIFALGTSAMGRQQSDMLHTQQQIASGRRVLTPADDPVAAAQALTVTQAKGMVDQYADNVGVAKDALGMNDSILGQATDVLDSVRTRVVSAGNAALSDQDRASLAIDVESSLKHLVGLANSTDGEGNYIFGGYSQSAPPFVQSAAGVTYNGDQGQRELQVSASRQLAIGENGSTVFEQIRTGNGSFVATAGAANAGTGVISAGAAGGVAATVGSYQISFTVTGGVTTYDVVNVSDPANPVPVISAAPYSDGGSITFDGLQVKIGGAPADGDVFDVDPSKRQSVFDTLQDLITTLQQPVDGAAAQASLENGLNVALQNLDQAQETVLTARAGVGARERELDMLSSSQSDRSLQYQQTLSQLQDLDYYQALSSFAQQQLALQAAQDSFSKLSKLSLFDYL
jgi:flagellar hook-associated protein 3 FlgL